MKVLSQPQIDEFIEHGIIVLENAFSTAIAAEIRARIWKHMGLEPDRPGGLPTRAGMSTESSFIIT